MIDLDSSPKEPVKLGIPKGSLEEPTLALFEQVGLQFRGGSRSLWLSSSDDEIVPVLLRPQEIPQYVRDGRLDAGLAGKDWVFERLLDTGEKPEDFVRCLEQLQYSKQTSRPIRWVLAVPESTEIETLDDLHLECQRRADSGDKQFLISTELTNLTERWLARNGIDARPEFSYGATEAKAGYFADAVVEATETGSSLRANGLRIVATVFESWTWYFANKQLLASDPWKRSKLEAVGALLKGALRASEYTEMTVLWGSTEDAEKAKELLPVSAKVLTVGDIHSGFKSTILLRKADVSKVMPTLLALGAENAWLTGVDMAVEPQPLFDDGAVRF